jgi:hypothetical protein
MKLQMLKSSKVNELRSNIYDNLELYRTGNFDFIFTDHSSYFECDIQIDESHFNSMIPDNSNYSEVANCKLMLQAMGGLTPYLARDERIWVYLTHSFLMNYTRNRWSIPADDEIAVKFIATHFFAKDKRGIERDNAASRLWWQATLCSRVKDLKLEDSLQCLLHVADVRASVIERPTTSQCLNVFSAIMKKLHESYVGDKKIFHRNVFRPLMEKLNLYGGIKLLNTMDESDIIKFLDDNICYSV